MTREKLRSQVLALFRAGVEAADPSSAVLRYLKLGPGGRPIIAGEEMGAEGRLHVVAFGKAACRMMEAALERLPPELLAPGSVVAVDAENCRPLEGCRVFRGGHPVPNRAGVEAARIVAGELGRSGPLDRVLALISGGGSSLIAAPAPGLTLADKVETTRLLLESGAVIQEVNTVRKHLSILKGGGLARVAMPSPVEALILSDVVGGDISSVASGPTVPDPTTFADALAVLRAYGLPERLPSTVLDHLNRGLRGEVPDTLKPGDPVFDRVNNMLIGSNRLSLDAVSAAAREMGYETLIASRELVGEARRVGSALSRHLQIAPLERPLAVLAGGETTVTVRGDGTGGRNQELALAFALAAGGRQTVAEDWIFLSGGTDGKDGPTDAAGAVIDSGTIDRGRRAGRDPKVDLDANNSNAFLTASGDLLQVGATGTNVADLQILLLRPGSST